MQYVGTMYDKLRNRLLYMFFFPYQSYLVIGPLCTSSHKSLSYLDPDLKGFERLDSEKSQDKLLGVCVQECTCHGYVYGWCTGLFRFRFLFHFLFFVSRECTGFFSGTLKHQQKKMRRGKTV